MKSILIIVLVIFMSIMASGIGQCRVDKEDCDNFAILGMNFIELHNIDFPKSKMSEVIDSVQLDEITSLINEMLDEAYSMDKSEMNTESVKAFHDRYYDRCMKYVK